VAGSACSARGDRPRIPRGSPRPPARPNQPRPSTGADSGRRALGSVRSEARQRPPREVRRCPAGAQRSPVRADEQGDNPAATADLGVLRRAHGSGRRASARRAAHQGSAKVEHPIPVTEGLKARLRMKRGATVWNRAQGEGRALRVNDHRAHRGPWEVRADDRARHRADRPTRRREPPSRSRRRGSRPSQRRDQQFERAAEAGNGSGAAGFRVAPLLGVVEVAGAGGGAQPARWSGVARAVIVV